MAAKKGWLKALKEKPPTTLTAEWEASIAVANYYLIMTCTGTATRYIQHFDDMPHRFGKHSKKSIRMWSLRTWRISTWNSAK